MSINVYIYENFNMKHNNFRTKTCVFTASHAHSAYMRVYETCISLIYTCISIQPADNPVEGKKRERVCVCGGGGGGGGEIKEECSSSF